MSLFGLTQTVNQPTHLCSGNLNSLIDLVFVSNPLSLSFCKVIPPLSNSDHLGIELEMQCKSTPSSVKHCPRRSVWKYSEADWERAGQLICACDWNVLLSVVINIAWMNWQRMFLSIMEKVIPRMTLSLRKKLP